MILRRSALARALFLSLLALGLTPHLARGAANPIQEFTLAGDPEPGGIVAGLDGNLWFSALNQGQLLRMSTAGKINGTFSVTGNLATEIPVGVTSGPDGNIWACEAGSDKIARFTLKGVLKEFKTTAGAEPVGIVTGPDGNLWFTEAGLDKIGRITTSGTITEFSITGGAEPAGIAAGPDGNLWFAEFGGNRIGRITTSGSLTEFTVPTGGADPVVIALGADNNLWFTEAEAGGQIGRITPSGVINEFPLPNPGAGPLDIVLGPDGQMWFTEIDGNAIGFINTEGVIGQFAVPTAGSAPAGIAVGPDGAIWFTELQGNKVGRVAPQSSSACTAGPATLCVDDQTGDRRWELSASFTSTDGAGNGQAIALSSVGVDHGGLFWFFGASNPEMLIKVLNGCSVNSQYWVFYAATTNVGFTVAVRDTKTGFVKLYTNPQNAAAPPVQDTSAEPCANGAIAPQTSPAAELAKWKAEQAALLADTNPSEAETLGPDLIQGCAGNSTTLCIQGRWKVTATYTTGTTHGTGQAIDASSLGVTQGGLFWFFGATNPEMLIKVLNGCALNNHYWIFYAATTNVGFSVTVTDQFTGSVKTYTNKDGTAAPPVQDTSALPCPAPS
jgi:streptogramin lyase